MAFYRTGGGGSATETVLWTNPSPTANFVAQTVTLSDDISNYDYMEISFNWTTSNDSSASGLFPTSEIPSSSGTVAFGMRAVNGSGNTRARSMHLDGADNKLNISSSYQLMTGQQTANNIYLIPTQIIGLKY